MGKGCWGRVGLGIDSVGGGRCCEEVYVVWVGRWWGGDGEGEQRGDWGGNGVVGGVWSGKGAGKAKGMCGTKGLGRCYLVSLSLSIGGKCASLHPSPPPHPPPPIPRDRLQPNTLR